MLLVQLYVVEILIFVRFHYQCLSQFFSPIYMFLIHYIINVEEMFIIIEEIMKI